MKIRCLHCRQWVRDARRQPIHESCYERRLALARERERLKFATIQIESLAQRDRRARERA